MSSVRHRAAKALLTAAAALAATAAAGTAAAQAVVVRSSGPSAAIYPQGKKLAVNAKVTLKAGDKITVLDKAGSRVLVGPGSFTLDNKIARDASDTGRVGAVLSGGGGARTRTGAVRGAPAAKPATLAPAAPDSVWYLDVSKGGAFCVADPAQLVLWRPNRAEEATGKLTPAGGKPVDVVWKRGSPLKLWPEQLPIKDGARFTFSDPVGPTVNITLHVLGAGVGGDDLAVAGVLADKGCLAQLDVFANTATAVGG